MAIHSAGYRAWQGQLSSPWTRWAVIAATGIRRASKSKWLRRMIFFSILPTLFFAVPFFLLEQSLRDPATARGLGQFLSDVTNNPQLEQIPWRRLSQASPEIICEVRHEVWANLLLTLFRYPQAFMMVLVVGIAAPPLISHDVRSRAFLIYFSRPISRLEYMLGKLGTVAFFLAMITTLPAMLLYLAGVLLSPDLSVVLQTWDLPLRIFVASLVLIVPTTAVALMFSSLTRESRYAGFAWFALWILGLVTYSVVMAFRLSHGMRGGYGQEEMAAGWTTLLSPYHTLGAVQAWVFGLADGGLPVQATAGLLVVTTVVSLGVLYRRVSSPMRA
jgi:ABC-type transport system involved in multi-copper enzyme maturation permease subunit